MGQAAGAFPLDQRGQRLAPAVEESLLQAGEDYFFLVSMLQSLSEGASATGAPAPPRPSPLPEALTPVLEVGERSVGVHVDVRHLAPTPPGHRVVCTARVIHVEGSVVSFQVEARDAKELIARGLHKRRVILAERFAARLRRKENPK